MKRLALVLIFLFIAPLANVSAGWSDTVQDDHWITTDSLGNRCGPELQNTHTVSLGWNPLILQSRYTIENLGNSVTIVSDNNSQPFSLSLLIELVECHSVINYSFMGEEVQLYANLNPAIFVPNHNTTQFELRVFNESSEIGWGILSNGSDLMDGFFFIQMSDRIQILFRESTNGLLIPALWNKLSTPAPYSDTRQISNSSAEKPCKLTGLPFCLDTNLLEPGIQPSHGIGPIQFTDSAFSGLRQTKLMRLHLVELGDGTNIPYDGYDELISLLGVGSRVLENTARVSPVIVKHSSVSDLYNDPLINQTFLNQITRESMICDLNYASKDNILRRLGQGLLGNSQSNWRTKLSTYHRDVDALVFVTPLNSILNTQACGIDFTQATNPNGSKGRVAFFGYDYQNMSSVDILRHGLQFAHELVHTLGISTHDTYTVIDSNNCSYEQNHLGQFVLKPSLSIMTINLEQIECYNPIYLSQSNRQLIWNGSNNAGAVWLPYTRTSSFIHPINNSYHWVPGGWKIEGLSVYHGTDVGSSNKRPIYIELFATSHNQLMHNLPGEPDDRLKLTIDDTLIDSVFSIQREVPEDCELNGTNCHVSSWTLSSDYQYQTTNNSATITSSNECRIRMEIGSCFLDAIFVLNEFDGSISGSIPTLLSNESSYNSFQPYSIRISLFGHESMDPQTGLPLFNPTGEGMIDNGVVNWVVI